MDGKEGFQEDPAELDWGPSLRYCGACGDLSGRT